MPAHNRSAHLIAAIVAALVSGQIRAYSGMAPQGGVLPRTIIHEITHEEDYCHDSATTLDAGVAESTIQFDCEGRTLTEAREEADRVAAIFSGATVAGAEGRGAIQAAFRESGGFSQPMDLDPGSGDRASSFRVSIDFRFIWRAT